MNQAQSRRLQPALAALSLACGLVQPLSAGAQDARHRGPANQVAVPAPAASTPTCRCAS